MRIRIAIIVAKITKTILKIAQKRGGSLPGKLAARICPNALSFFEYPPVVIMVTGTNGKTTTTNMIYKMLSSKYDGIISNIGGDNLIAGITTLVLTKSNLNCRLKYDAMVIEVDEITVHKVIKEVKVTHFIINNLFRDQLDRAGEMETIIRGFERSLTEYSGQLILNGDDPNVSRLGYDLKNTNYFGVEKWNESKLNGSEASEGKFCFKCQHELKYDYYQYSHIGMFNCPNCDFGDFTKFCVAQEISDDCKHFTVDGVRFTSPYETIYALYNCMAVIAIAKLLEVDYELAEDALKSFEMNDGRMEKYNLNRECLLNLIKNPTGANEVIKYIVREKKPKDIWIVLNDNGQDGRDVSWVYDVNFELLNNANVKNIICSGTRGYDMALCIKYNNYAGNIAVFENDEDAVKRFSELNNEGYIMVTYTALQTTRKRLARYEK